MGWFTRSSEKPTQIPTQVRELSPEDRADIEYMLDDGARPSEIARTLGVDPRLIYTINRERNRSARELPRARPYTMAANPSQPTDDERARIRAEIEETKLRDELARVKADVAYNERRRQLELEKLELEIEQKRAELYGEDEEEEYGAGWEEFAHDPEYAMWNFFGKVMDKQQAKQTAPPPQPGPALDVAKPLTREEIRAYMKRFSDQQIYETQQMPAFIVKRELAKQFPGITEENIKRIMYEIRHYGDQAQPVQEGVVELEDPELVEIEQPVVSSSEAEGSSPKRQPRRNNASERRIGDFASEGDGKPVQK